MTANELGNRIKYVRKNNKMTQADFGKIVGKEYTTIGRYEKGTLPVPSDVLIAIVEHFNLSADWLLLGTTKDTSDLEKTNYDAELNTLFDSLSPDNKKEIIDYMHFKLARQ